MTTTWRADIVTALVAILNDESTAHPTLLRKVYPSRPASFGETPAAYIGPRNESVTHDTGTRTRTFSGLEIVVIDAYRDNIQTGDLLDQLVDNLIDRFDLPANVQRIGSSIIEITQVTDTDIDVVGPERTVTYRGVVFSLSKSAKLEGRQ